MASVQSRKEFNAQDKLHHSTMIPIKNHTKRTATSKEETFHSVSVNNCVPALYRHFGQLNKSYDYPIFTTIFTRLHLSEKY